MSTQEIYYLSASTMARLIRKRKISSDELVRACFKRIDQINPILNAFVQSNYDRALEEAHKADHQIAQGDRIGPLHGVPFTVKDWLDAAGLACTGGFVEHKDRVALTDATVVTRMRQAGGILLGKTNVMADNPVYGRTNNPYNPGYTASYSSSGEAALIAAGGSPLGLGSDSGGSIRLPAGACGVAGLKPTTGRIPLTGHFPFISAINDPRTTIGPLARSVEDLGLALNVIQGVDWRDASVIPMPIADWQKVDTRKLRVAYYTRHADANPEPIVEETCVMVAGILEGFGMKVENVLPPRIEEASQITRDYWARPESNSADEWENSTPTKLSSLEVEQHLFQLDRFRRSMVQFMENYDIILTPVAEKTATPHGEDSGWIPYTLPFSLTGYPCVVVRAGTSINGLPVGVQVVARPWRDDAALAVAALIEKECGGWQPPQLD